MKRFLIVASLVVVSFAVGYLPQHFNAVRMEAQLADTSRVHERELMSLEERLAISELQNRLGMVLLELGQNNSGRAQALAGEYFDGVTELAFMFSDSNVRQQLREIGSQRDRITLSLASPTPDTTRQLNQIYLQMSRFLE